MSEALDLFRSRGWLRFPVEPALRRWAEHAREAARVATAAPANAHWLRCGGTWFVGVDALPNDAHGAIDGGPPLRCSALDLVRESLPGGTLPLHRAQLSVCYSGYPKPSEGESEAAFGFRVMRDAAHVDGLLLGDPQRRRFLREPHAWILGIGLETPAPGASPTVLWDGSHQGMTQAFTAALGPIAPDAWSQTDITAPYQQARREAFTRCERIEMPLGCGEALLVHRHLLHGIAPWQAEPAGRDRPRAVAWFRPQFRDIASWLWSEGESVSPRGTSRRGTLGLASGSQPWS